jgi:gamma-glutamyltranspeptidase/glutathione hydrolase
MAPTLVFSRASGELVASLGSPGGSQIIGYVNKALVGLLDWQLDPQQAAGLPNFGSRNAGTEVEAGLSSPALIRQLAAWGHEVTPMTMTSGMQIIQRSGEGCQAVPTLGGKVWPSVTSRDRTQACHSVVEYLDVHQREIE